MDFQFDTTADGRTLMRETRSHLCTVVDTGEAIGLITLNDVLERLLESGVAASLIHQRSSSVVSQVSSTSHEW